MDLNEAYQGDKDFWFLCHHGRIPDYWISKDKYKDYWKFLPLFDHPKNKHVDYGGAIIQYDDADPELGVNKTLTPPVSVVNPWVYVVSVSTHGTLTTNC